MEHEHLVFNHKIPIQIRFNDIDVIGHVYNAIYQDYFDYARIQYLNKVLQKKINWKEIALVVANINVDYFEPILLSENIFVFSKVIKIGNKSIEMIQKLENDKQELKSIGKTILVGFDYNTKNSIEVSEEWRRKISAFEKDLIF